MANLLLEKCNHKAITFPGTVYLMQKKYSSVLNLNASGNSHVGLLLTNEKPKRLTCDVTDTHFCHTFWCFLMTSLIQTAEYKMAVFTVVF